MYGIKSLTIIPHGLLLVTACIFTIHTHTSSAATEPYELYYIRSDIKTSNGEVVETNLLMIPAKEEFRIKQFKRYTVTGTAHINSKPDIQSAAKHNALKSLLLAAGVKSIQNTSTNTNTKHHEESVLSYEGFIKTPYKVLKQGYSEPNNNYHLEMEVLFAPVAYPSEWTFYYFKKKLYDTLHNMISVFW